MSIPTYDRDKYYRILDRTQSNYANQLKRLSKDAKRSSFIIIYYSIALIIYSLSVIVYPNLFDSRWTSYSSIILSIIVLVYSIINGNAGYPKRIYSIQNALNEVKRLKREVGELPDLSDVTSPHANRALSQDHSSDKIVLSPQCNQPCGCTNYSSCERNSPCVRLETLKEEYDDLVSSTEIRDDLDFYYTIIQLCKKYSLDPFSGKSLKDCCIESSADTTILDEIRGYISENNPKAQRRYICLLKLWHGFLYLAPLIIFILGIIFNKPITPIN